MDEHDDNLTDAMPAECELGHEFVWKLGADPVCPRCAGGLT